MKRVLLIGSNGLLGSSLFKYLAPDYDVVTVTRKSDSSDFQVDMASKKKSDLLLSNIKPDFIINLAALTNVQLCEDNISLAYQVNTKIAENIAKYCESNCTVVIHISTDHFYNRENSSEDDVDICNNYAMTKYCAEKSFKNENAVILRTNFFGKSLSSSSEGLCNNIYNQVKKGTSLKFFNDVYFSPVSILTLCEVISLCLRKKIPGVYNVGSNDGMSKEDFLFNFLTKSGVKNFDYKSISIDNVNLSTPRPKDMRMNVSLFERTYNYKLPTLINEIEKVANEFKK